MTLLNTEPPASVLFETEFDVPVAAAEPVPPIDTFEGDADDKRSTRTLAERALSMLSNRERFRDSAAQRTGALVFASLEEAAATDRQTSAIERQTAVMEAQLAVAQQQLTQNVIANQLAFFALNPSDFTIRRGPEPVGVPDGGGGGGESLYTQMKRNIGILPPATSASPAPASTGEPHTDGETGDEDLGG